ncbi:helix-turn-helix transcriptional regulator [Streptacidiphilus fuscans]|uniref:Helix-turn-helix domain-containing protein n=1 Tax=Streptacidiphilus fuscans TaxID=2789292 RepID=A0A931FCM0_9ACTN|nr:helix-turn-helix transcriptional regulator [Streptacidiphilus fuscans]MBF9069872.1 helix-turn-helix domain-containing protein [Streptacidiphilus fuscans]MBF9073454.1 helix-turn-helix domain-containing protein [Streptacidiphilus fuscans]
MTKTPDQRRELGAFLRSRRERITPEQVGLPCSLRRRTPGLRREELALLAGISATWYTYLEQGRPIQVSDQVLDALAKVLRLDRHERTHLLELAGRAPAVADDGRVALDPAAAVVPLLLQPQPAYIIDGAYDVLGHNQAAAELFPFLRSHGDRPANFARWVFLDPEARHVVVDWEREASGLLARLRQLAGRRPQDPRYPELIGDLVARSPEAQAWWPRHDVQDRQGGRKRLRRQGAGVTTFSYSAFHLAEQPEHTLVVYVDEASVPQSEWCQGRSKPSEARASSAAC